MARTVWGFDEAVKHVSRVRQVYKKNMKRATLENSISLRDGIKRTIRDGHPEWEDLSPLTTNFKQSEKPLIDSGDLMNAVDFKTIGEMMFFIGIPRRAKSRDGLKLVNIAMVHEKGATIKPKKAKMLCVPLTKAASRLARKHGGVRNIPGLFRPEGTKVLAMPTKGGFKPVFVLLPKSVIPPRPFVEPTLRAHRAQMTKRWLAAADATMRGEPYRAAA